MGEIADGFVFSVIQLELFTAPEFPDIDRILFNILLS